MEPHLDRPRPFPFFWVVALVTIGAAATAVDLPVARWIADDRCPRVIHKLLDLAEVFGHGAGVTAILLSVAVLDPRRRWALPRLALASLGAGLTANIFKLLVARVRPHHFDLAGNVSETIIKWFPFSIGKSYEEGFPSSHTATAAGLAVGLTWLYPRGKWLFMLFAVLAAGQRIESMYHFLSDTICGAAIGVAVASWSTRTKSLGYLGNRVERWLRRNTDEGSPAEPLLAQERAAA
jgi:membrane-associated phospholipid phosphatase